MFEYLAAPSNGRRPSSTPASGFAYPPHVHAHAHHAQRTSTSNFIPPPLPRDESSGGTAFLADLASVQLPPVADATTYAHNCDACGTALSGRPRVECLECRHLVCSNCYSFERPANHHHRQTHLQKTLRPREYPPHHWHPRTADYFCDRCNIDLTHAPRARCVTCSNYDLCLDCLILGETSLRHRLSHSINVITSHIPSTPTSGQPQPGGGGGGGGGPILMSESDHQPTPLLEKILDSIYDYIDTAFPPRSSGLLEPSKLSAFYSHHGVPSSTNLFRLLPNEELALEFSRLGCEYHLTSDSVDAIAARKKPWSQDSIDTTPRSPSLTRRGWIRFFVLEIWRDPDLMHFVLSGALSTGKILNKRKGEPYRLSCPRDALPRSGRGREWDAGGGGGGRRRAGSRPSSRGP